MHYLSLIISTSWILFVLVWFAGSLTAKRNLKTVWWRNAWLRILIALIIYVLFRQQLIEWFRNGPTLVSNPVLGIVGTLLTVAGIMFAIWARFYIGRNWGMPMSLKENRELVTSGPYRYVRHPIYTGVILAMIGSALVVGLWLLIPIAIYFLYFIFSATYEEKILTKEFPDAYPDYKKRTKMFIPFIL